MLNKVSFYHAIYHKGLQLGVCRGTDHNYFFFVKKKLKHRGKVIFKYRHPETKARAHSVDNAMIQANIIGETDLANAPLRF